MAKLVLKKLKLSNKNKTLPNTISHSGTDAPFPFIDKISIIVKPQSESQATEMHEKVTAGFENVVIHPISSGKTVSDPKSGKKSFSIAREYNYSKFLQLPNELELVLFQCAFSKKIGRVEKFRLEFNPSKLVNNGLGALDFILAEFLPNGWEFVLKHGTISRLDIAVDLPGVRMDDFMSLSSAGISNRNWSSQGQLETLYFGKSRGNQTVIYDKKKEQQSKGVTFEGPTVVRYERRLRVNVGPLHALASRKNEFMAVSLLRNNPPCPMEWSKKKKNEWSMFQDSAAVRGASNALSLLPAARKTTYRKYLKLFPAPWWNPEAIWANWPKALQSLS